jgi:hypothetical protein
MLFAGLNLNYRSTDEAYVLSRANKIEHFHKCFVSSLNKIQPRN